MNPIYHIYLDRADEPKTAVIDLSSLVWVGRPEPSDRLTDANFSIDQAGTSRHARLEFISYKLMLEQRQKLIDAWTEYRNQPVPQPVAPNDRYVTIGQGKYKYPVCLTGIRNVSIIHVTPEHYCLIVQYVTGTTEYLFSTEEEATTAVGIINSSLVMG